MRWSAPIERLAPRTFRGRLTLSLTLLSFGTLAGAGALIYVGARQALLANLDSALLSIARADVASAFDAPGGALHLHEDLPAALALSVGSGYEKFAQIKTAQHQLAAQTANLAAAPLLESDAEREARALDGHVLFADLRRGPEMYRGVYYPLRAAGGERFVAIVAIPKRPVQRSLQLLATVLLIAFVAGGGAAAWAAGRLARHLTRPLELIAHAAHGVGETNLSARIPRVSRDQELDEFTSILNQMLTRLEAAFGTQRQLVTAQRRFIADASHELRSPLANLRGTIEVALRRPRTAEDYRETLATALSEIERLSRLVNDLLTLSRIDAGQLTLHPAPCDLVRIATEAIAAHAAPAEQRGVHLQLAAAAPASIVCDADQLRRVLENLLDNALRYAPAASAVVISVEADAATTSLSVRDAGPGLHPDDHAYIFDRFYRADASRTRESGGLGLGLAIASAIVSAHHGTLSVDSQRGEGCCFTVRLPTSPPASDPDAPATSV